MIDIEREAETQAEGEAGSALGAPRGTRSWDSRIPPWTKDRRQTAEPPRDPQHFNILVVILLPLAVEWFYRQNSLPTPAAHMRIHTHTHVQELCGLGQFTSPVRACLLVYKVKRQDPWVAQRFSTAFSPGPDPGDPGSSPTSGSLHGACFSLSCVSASLSLSLSVSLMNK